MSGLHGQAAVVTGASRGIGAQTARALAAAGVSVVLAARDGAACEAIAGEIRAGGGTARAIACDVARAADVAAAVALSREAFGRLDILINNAGVIAPIGLISKTAPEAWSGAIDVNLKGVYHGVRAALPHMTAQRSGVILTISSGAAHNPLEGWSAYCAGKAGAAMLTRVAHLEAGARGVRILGLSPGTVATDMQVAIKASGMNPVSQLDWSAHIPADWPARAVVWLCGPGGADYAGQEVSLRDEAVRRRVGLIE